MSPSEGSALTPEATRVYRRHVETAAEAVREHCAPVPSLALLLSPALSDPPSFEEDNPADDEALPHGPWAEKTPPLSVGTLDGTRVVLLRGTLALHEGYTPREVVFPVRALIAAGVETLLCANTATSVRADIEPGALVWTADHINFQGANPLVGPNVEAWGPRFPDMTAPYDETLRTRAEKEGLRAGIKLQSGVYLAVLGPASGTHAEHRMARTLGADVVGTDTVPEVLAARHMGARVGALSAVTAQAGPGAAGAGPDEALRTAQPALQALLSGVAARVKSKEKSV